MSFFTLMHHIDRALEWLPLIIGGVCMALLISMFVALLWGSFHG